MNPTLNNLTQNYLNNGTGSVIVYYDFLSGSTGVVGAGSNFTGTILNTSPSFLTNANSGLVLEATGSTAGAAANLLGNFLIEDSGGNFTYSNIEITSFSGNGFLPPEDYESKSIFLFSFEKINSEDGVLFGSLVRDDFDNGDISFNYGRGFNIGVNDRNQLFFQGIDSTLGEYVLVANELELANKNICSVKVNPYEISFAHYNLSDDSFGEQYIRSDSKIQNIDLSEKIYLGTSNSYLRGGNTFSGYLDHFMIISGDHSFSDLKSVASGFVSTGQINSGASFSRDFITGVDIDLIYPVGVTGYNLSITGYESAITNSNLIEFVLTEDTTESTSEGERFFTGYSLPNNSGDYLEETSYLIKDNRYDTSGDNAFSTLGLKDSGDLVTKYVLSSTKIVSTTGIIPLYGLSPITGFLLEFPSGFSRTNLFQTINFTGSLSEDLIFKDGIVDKYRHDYLYYLGERI